MLDSAASQAHRDGESPFGEPDVARDRSRQPKKIARAVHRKRVPGGPGIGLFRPRTRTGRDRGRSHRVEVTCWVFLVRVRVHVLDSAYEERSSGRTEGVVAPVPRCGDALGNREREPFRYAQQAAQIDDRAAAFGDVLQVLGDGPTSEDADVVAFERTTELSVEAARGTVRQRGNRRFLGEA